MKANKFFALLLLLLMMVCASAVSAQSDRGSLTGSVKDPSGALVPNAKVTATNLNSGEARETTTSDEGSYTLPELKADPYRLTVEAPGFKTATVEQIQVAVQTTRRADVTLEIGIISDVITVAADTTVLQTDTPVRQTNVNERQVRELPLQVTAESGGRTPLAFIFLDSNVNAAGGTSGGGGSATNFRVSGGQGLGTEILIDGAATRRQQNGTFFSEVAPGPNAYQEFTLSTSTYSAEFGNSSGGLVNLALKSGGNEFHGEFYDLVRNESLNANTFINNARGFERDRDNQNDFGFNIGGPIYLPHFGEGGPVLKSLKNRGFFFYNYEGYRFTTGETDILTVPTLKMRTGDFSELLTDPSVLNFFPADPANGRPVAGEQIYDPRQNALTRTAIPGNRLDLYQNGAAIDPAGFAALQFFPLPNRPGVVGNYVSDALRPLKSNQSTGKVDFVLSDKQRLNFSYSFRRNNRIVGFPRFPLPFTNQGVFQQNFKTYLGRIQHDYTISPKLLNHFNIGYTRYDVANANTSAGFNTSGLGIPVNATQNAAFPRIGFPNYFGADPRRYQDIGSTEFTDRIRDNTIQASDAVTYVSGRHTIKFGADFRTSQFNVTQFIDPGGSFNFQSDQTAFLAPAPVPGDPNRRVLQGGSPIASLITGATEFAFNSTNSIEPAFRQFNQSYFFQDDIKVTPRLTLNVGLRYDLPGLRYEASDRFRTFDPTVVNPAVGRLGAIIGAGGQGGLQAAERTLAKPDHTNIGPRLGFAYSFDSKTVIRAGGGIYYAPILYGEGGRGDINSGTQGYNTTGQLFTPDGPNARFFLSSFPSRPPVAPNGQLIGADVQFFDPDFKTGRTIQYSFDIQRELPFNLAASIGYIGSKATRLRSDFQRINAVPFNALRLGFPILNKNVNDLNAADRNYAQSIGIALPASSNAVFPGFNGSVAQALKPFPQYGRISNILESDGTADYNALQVKLDRRFAQGFQFGASYTFSKLITDAAEDVLGQNPLGGILQIAGDRNDLRSVSPNNPAHVFVINYLFELPLGKGKRFLNRGGLVDKVFGGFQVGGIQRYQSGLPLIFFTSEGGRRGFLDLIGVNGNLRLNLTGSPIFTGNDGSTLVRPVNPNDPSEVPGFVIINRNAFALPPNFQNPPNSDPSSAAYRAYYSNPLSFFGNVGILPNVKSDAFLSENISVLKKTRLTETLVLELGAEVFNLFNRKRFFAPTTDFSADPRIFGFQSIINDREVFSPRVVQLRVKVLF
ncbi:MAG TPA: TonB-dependent receptor [Pyrinomonadaceae bacterium]